MRTHEIRQKLNMSQKEFSIEFGIPVATVRNWDARGTMPYYVYELIERIILQNSEFNKLYLETKGLFE